MNWQKGKEYEGAQDPYRWSTRSDQQGDLAHDSVLSDRPAPDGNLREPLVLQAAGPRAGIPAVLLVMILIG